MDAARSSVCSGVGIDLLHPELMTADTIIKILKEKHVKHPRLEELDKVSLVELYYGTVLPFPQREYRNNRLGNCLSDKRKTSGSQKRKSGAEDDKAASREAKRPRTHDSHQLSRLKPSPDQKLSAREKATRLDNHADSSHNTSRNGSSHDTSSRGTPKLNDSKNHTAEDEGAPGKKKRRPITWP